MSRIVCFQILNVTNQYFTLLVFISLHVCPFLIYCSGILRKDWKCSLFSSYSLHSQWLLIAPQMDDRGKKKINTRERKKWLLLHTIHILEKMAKLRHTMNLNMINYESVHRFAESDCISLFSILSPRLICYRDAQQMEKNTVWNSDLLGEWGSFSPCHPSWAARPGHEICHNEASQDKGQCWQSAMEKQDKITLNWLIFFSSFLV